MKKISEQIGWLVKGMAIFALLCAGKTSQAQNLDALLDVSRFRVTDSTSFLELNMLVLGHSVVYAKQSKGKYQARVALTIEVADSSGQTRAADKLALLSPIVADTAKEKPSFQTLKRFLLPNGNYILKLSTSDANTKKPETRLEVPVTLGFAPGKMAVMSDIQLLSSFQKADAKAANSPFVKNGYELLANPSTFFPGHQSKLRFYTEIYETARVVGLNEPLVITYGLYPERSREPLHAFSKMNKQKAQPVNVVLAEIDITKLPSGNYRLQVEVRDKNNKIQAIQHKVIQRSNPDMNAVVLDETSENQVPGDAEITFAAKIDSAKLGFYLLSHQPLATTNEMDFIKGLIASGNTKNQRRYLEHFWRRRSENNPEGFWNDYRKRIEYVESTFATKNLRGFMTDRGRVYLQYGPPNIIHNERTDVKRNPNSTDVLPYQIWHYYNIGNQNNKVFVFVQKNLGNDNFRLEHSDMRGEPSNPEWRNEVVQQKFSGTGRD